MPILRKESDIFPDDLFSMSLESAPWEVVHVRSRQEKILARVLLEFDQPFYLPQVQNTTRRSGRTFTSYMPLFSGYVFIRRTEQTRPALWKTGAVVRRIEVADQATLDRELRQIRSLQLTGAILVPAAPAPGTLVEIKEGVFSGYTGIVVSHPNAFRLLVTITTLNKTVLAEFPASAAKVVSGRGGRAARSR